MDFKVTFAAQAERDLFAIVSFLAEKNPAAARRLGDALLDTALSLAQMRESRRGSGSSRNPQAGPSPLPFGFYRADETRRLVEIARFWDGRQAPSLLKMA